MNMSYEHVLQRRQIQEDTSEIYEKIIKADNPDVALKVITEFALHCYETGFTFGSTETQDKFIQHIKEIATS